MKKIVIAGVLGIAAAVLAHMHVVSQRYYPLVKVTAPDGLVYIAVQDETLERRACGDANDRFLEPLRAHCKDCEIVAARCERIIEGDEATALLEGQSVPGYLLVSPGLRLAISGPADKAKTNCDLLAADMVRRGVRRTSCVHPKPASAT